MRRATASSGMPRAATYEPPSSQLPRWPVTNITPRPCAMRALHDVPPVDLLERGRGPPRASSAGRSAVSMRRAAEMLVRLARDAQHLGLGESGKCRAHLALHDGASDAEGPVAEHRRSTRRSSPARSKLSRRSTPHGATQTVVLERSARRSSPLHRAGPGGPVARGTLPPRRIPRSSPASLKSRCARVQPALPIASR